MNWLKFFKNWWISKKKEIQTSDNAPLLKQIEELKEGNATLRSLLTKANATIINITQQLVILQEENNKLKNPPIKNILEYKKQYELQRVQKPYKYAFKGDGIDIDIKWALHLDKEQEEAFKKECIQPLIKQYKPKTVYDVLEFPQKYFSKSQNWKYQKEQGDLWSIAIDSWRTLVGDCDDLAILMHNIIYYTLLELGYEEHAWRLLFVSGILNGEGGHAFNMWLHDDGYYYVIESTYDLSGSFNRNWLNTPVNFDNTYKSFRGFATKQKSWVGSMSALKNVIINEQ